MKLKLLMVLCLVLVYQCLAEPPPEPLVKKLTDIIRSHCADAEIGVTNDVFRAKYGTMMFTLHTRQKTGEVSTNTYREEGPNFKGFLLTVTLEKGGYQGAAVVPQELHGPYFPTFLNAPRAEDGQHHYLIHFAYGSRLDPKLKAAILEALPGSTAFVR
jgi:hypothetical protein